MNTEDNNNPILEAFEEYLASKNVPHEAEALRATLKAAFIGGMGCHASLVARGVPPLDIVLAMQEAGVAVEFLDINDLCNMSDCETCEVKSCKMHRSNLN